MATSGSRHQDNTKNCLRSWWGGNQVSFLLNVCNNLKTFMVDRIELVTNRSPLISILAHLYNNLSELPPHIQFLYTTKPASANTDEILFLPRLRALFSSRHSSERRLDLYLTTSTAPSLSLSSAVIGTGNGSPNAVSTHNRRITHHDLLSALGPVEARQGVVAYVCGPPNMTDEFVDVLRKAEGMDERRVLCEKWW